jgi:hypothetical protein
VLDPYNAFRKASAGPFSGVWGHSGKAMSELQESLAKLIARAFPDLFSIVTALLQRNLLNGDAFVLAASPVAVLRRQF